MTPDLFFLLLLLTGAIGALLTGVLRPDITALSVLVIVALFGLAPVDRVLGGFSNTAVLAVAGMYVLSTALARTGVADWVGERLIGWAGEHERRLVLAIVLFSGALSAFINNVGVAAMMLPVTVRLARQTRIAPSRLLIPMVMGAQLGGITTLIANPANLLAAGVLADGGFTPLHLFSFLPIGLILLVSGALFLIFAAPRLIPARDPEVGRVTRPPLREGVGMEEGFFRLTLPARTVLDGRSLGQSLIGPALGVHVLAVERAGGRERILAPGPATLLAGGDRLLVQGRPELFAELRGRRHLAADGSGAPAERLTSGGRALAAIRLEEDDAFVGSTLHEAGFRGETGALVLAIVRDGRKERGHVQDTVLRAGDELLLLAPEGRIDELAVSERFRGLERLEPRDAVARFGLGRRLWSLRVTEDSLLAGRKLGSTRLGDSLGLMVLALSRDGDGDEEETVVLPGPETEFHVGDQLLVRADMNDLLVLRALQHLELETGVEPAREELESRGAGFAEVVLAPRSRLIGKTLRQAGFRRRFGMHVVAVIREGTTLRTDLRDEVLRFGDALLLHGSRRRARELVREPDLILLHEPGADPPDPKLAPRSLAVMAVALGPIALGWVPVAVGILLGVVLMILTRCLSVEEAYRAIEWPVLVMLVGMLALAGAVEETGAAAILGDSILLTIGELGPRALMAAFLVVTALAAQVIPGSAVVVLMAPLAASGATQLGVEPHAMVLGVAIAAVSVASPLAQPSLALVMAPAGYNLRDYLPIGAAMTALVLTVVLLVAPILFPF